MIVKMIKNIIWLVYYMDGLNCSWVEETNVI